MIHSFPKSVEKSTTYSDLTWDAAKSKFKYNESTDHWCTEEAVAEYKTHQQNVKSAAESADTAVTIAAAEEEISWVEAGEATKS